LLRSFFLLQQVEPGFLAPAEQVLTLTLAPNPARYPDERAGIAFYERLLERVRALPGVASAAVSDSLPPDRQGDGGTLVIEGTAARATAPNPAVSPPMATPGYFSAPGPPLPPGPPFPPRDPQDSPLVTVISETMARRYFAGRDPIGPRLKESGSDLPSPY